MIDALAVGSALFLVYTYGGYLLILWLLGCVTRRRALEGDWPAVTVVIPAHNEEACLAKALESVLASEYPRDIQVIVVSDASQDATDEITHRFSAAGVKLLRLDRRSGKTAALTAASAQATTEVLVFADASGVFEPTSVARIVRHFRHDDVGSCVGAKRIIPTQSTVARGDGLYWRYESLLRHAESRLGSSRVGLEGGFFAVRSPLVRFDFAPHLAEDYSLGCRIYESGYRTLYDPTAVIHERATRGMAAESGRKIRVIVRGIQAFFAFAHLLNPIRHPGFCFQNVSHRLCRWLAPFVLLTLLVSTGFATNPWLSALFWAQVLFYLIAAAGAMLQRRGRSPRLVAVPLYFTSMNLAALVAWFLLSRRYRAWDPPGRE